MTPMTKLLTTAIDTLETCNRGYRLVSYDHNGIVFQESNPLRGNTDRQLRITEDKVNGNGYILTLFTYGGECAINRGCAVELPQAELWFTDKTELEIALQVFCNYPLADTIGRPCYSERTTTYYLRVNDIYERLTQLYDGEVKETGSGGLMFIDKNAYLDGELIVSHSEEYGIRLLTGGCLLQLNHWKYSNSALDSWLSMFKTFVDKLREVRK